MIDAFNTPIGGLFLFVLVSNIVLALILGHEPRLHWRRPWIR